MSDLISSGTEFADAEYIDPGERTVYEAFAPLIGTSYQELNCWDLVRRLYRDGLGIDIDKDHYKGTKQFVETWWHEDEADLQATIEPWDLLIFRLTPDGPAHVAVACDGMKVAQTHLTRGAVLDNLTLIKPYIAQSTRLASRIDFNAEALAHLRRPLNERPVHESQHYERGYVRTLISPIRGARNEIRYYRERLQPGKPISAHFCQAAKGYHYVFLNSKVIKEEDWGRVIVCEDDDLILVPIWEVVADLIPILIAIAVSIAITLITTYLFAPSDPEQNEAETSYTGDGQRSHTRSGRPVPVIYGEIRLGIQYFYREVVDQAHYIDTGIPPAINTIDGMTGGEGSNDENGFNSPIIITAIGHGLTDLEVIIIDNAPGVSRLLGHRFNIVVIDDDNFRLAGSGGMVENINYQGGGTYIRESSYVLDAQDHSTRYLIVGGIGEGEVEEVRVDTIEINQQPIENYPDVVVETRPGTATQTPLSGVPGTANSYGVGVELQVNVPLVYSTIAEIEEFTIHLEWSAGLVHITKKGSTSSNSVDILYRFRVSGTVPWGPPTELTIRGNKTGTLRKALTRKFLPKANYDIEVRFFNPRHSGALSGSFVPTVRTITERDYDVRSYENTSVIKIEGPFTEQVQGSFPNVTIQVKGRKVRQGSFAAAETYTENPAWACMDYMTNARYGKGLPDSAIDLAAFVNWANYCDEQVNGRTRHRLSFVIDSFANSQQHEENLRRSSRTEMLYVGGQYSPRVTRNDSPQYIFGPNNMRNFQMTYIRDIEQINVIEANFWNELDDYQPDTMVFPQIDGGDYPAEPRVHRVELRGVGNPEEAATFCERTLKTFQIPSFTVSFEGDYEALLIQKHDVIGVAHPVPGVGEAQGRVGEGTNTILAVTLDQDVTILAGNVYRLYILFDDMTYEIRQLNNAPGVTRVLTVAPGSEFSQVPAPVVTKWFLGRSVPTDTTIRTVRVTNTSLTKEGVVRINAIDHNPSLYDDGPAIPLDVINIRPSDVYPPPPLLQEQFLVFEHVRQQGDGRPVTSAHLSWVVGHQKPQHSAYWGAKILRKDVLQNSDIASSEIGESEILDAIPDSEFVTEGWETLATTPGLRFEDTEVLVGLTYLYRVIPINERGIPNNHGYVEGPVHITGAATPQFTPPPPVALRLIVAGVVNAPGDTEYEGNDIAFAWNAPPTALQLPDDLEINRYEVQIWTTDGAYPLHTEVVTDKIFPFHRDTNTADSLLQGLNFPQRDITISVWSVTNTGVKSASPIRLRAFNPQIDMSVITPANLNAPLSARLDWGTFNAPPDLDHYDVYFGTDNPPQTRYESKFKFETSLLISPLVAGTTYYARVAPSDSFGMSTQAGWSQTVTIIPLGVGIGDLDSNPPPTPSGLVLTSVNEPQEDGTEKIFLEATWNVVVDPEGSRVSYELQLETTNPNAPAGFQTRSYSRSAPENFWREEVSGGTTFIGQVLALDSFGNASAFSPTATHTTAPDTIPPGPVTNLTGSGFLRTNVLQYSPPSDTDFERTEVFASMVDDFNTATSVGFGNFSSFDHRPLGNEETWYYWVQALDNSGNESIFTPLTGASGLAVTTVKVTSDDINVTPEVLFGDAFPLNPPDNQLFWHTTLNGLFRYNPVTMLWDQLTPGPIDGTQILPDAIQTPHLSAGLVTANELAAGSVIAGKVAAAAINGNNIAGNSITANELSTGELITNAAQIANALINDAHISNVSANKIVAGIIQANLGLGVGDNIKINGVSKTIQIFDDQVPPQLRIQMGQIGPDVTNWGAVYFNEDGVQLMNTAPSDNAGFIYLGALRANIIDATHIISQTIAAQHLTTSSAVITDQVQMGAATINTAQIIQAAIKEAQIDNLAVNTIKVADGALTTRLEAASAVGYTQIAANAETNLLNVVVTTPAIAAGELGTLEVHVDVDGQIVAPQSSSMIISGRLYQTNPIGGEFLAKDHLFQVGNPTASDSFNQSSSIAFNYFQNITLAGTYTFRLALFANLALGTATAFYRKPTLIVKHLKR